MWYNYGIKDKVSGKFLMKEGDKYTLTHEEFNAMKFLSFDEAHYVAKQMGKDMMVYLLPIRKYKMEERPYRVACDNVEQRVYVYNRFSGKCTCCVSFGTVVELLKNNGYIIDGI